MMPGQLAAGRRPAHQASPAHVAQQGIAATRPAPRAQGVGTDFSGNQSRLRRLRAAIGPHAGSLAGIEVSDPGEAAERAAVAAADTVTTAASGVVTMAAFGAVTSAASGAVTSAASRAVTSAPPGAAPRATRGAPNGAAPSLVPLLGSSVALSPDLRAALAPGRDAGPGDVRLHIGDAASRTAAALGARAFTLGRDIVFAKDAYAPHSPDGRKLLAHELAHVAAQPAIPRIFRDEAKAETDAEVDQRILKGLTDLVASHPVDDETRLTPLVDLFATVPQARIEHLYRRLDPGAPTDDFAQYFKDKFSKTRSDGLGYLRNHVAGGLPGQSAPVTGDVGANTAAAAASMPSGMHFQGAMVGDGWFLNPKYWVVKYILRKGNDSKVFTSETGKPTPLQQLQAFRETDKSWDVPGLTTDIEISIGSFGAAAAMQDAWNAASAPLYGYDCLNAAWMVQLRGRYMSYPAATRDVDFDRDYKTYVNHFTPDSQTRSNAADFDEIHLAAQIPLSHDAEIAAVLKPGDETTISNPFMPATSAFRNENVVYVGEMKFLGHPFGTFTLPEYAAKLKDQADKSLTTDAEKIDWVLQKTFIQDISRPKQK
jgi:hypothetical protein